MLTIKELLARTQQRNVTVGPTVSVADAVDLLSDHDIGAIVVVDDAGAAIGILSERDVVRAISATGSEALARPVQDLMTKSIVKSSPSEALLPSISRMLLHGIRHDQLGVTVDGRLPVVGLLKTIAGLHNPALRISEIVLGFILRCT